MEFNFLLQKICTVRLQVASIILFNVFKLSRRRLSSKMLSSASRVKKMKNNPLHLAEVHKETELNDADGIGLLSTELRLYHRGKP